jgi:hypothetical protein
MWVPEYPLNENQLLIFPGPFLIVIMIAAAVLYSVKIILCDLTLPGLRPEEFEEFFWKESSMMRGFFLHR